MSRINSCLLSSSCLSLITISIAALSTANATAQNDVIPCPYQVTNRRVIDNTVRTELQSWLNEKNPIDRFYAMTWYEKKSFLNKYCPIINHPHANLVLSGNPCDPKYAEIATFFKIATSSQIADLQDSRKVTAQNQLNALRTEIPGWCDDRFYKSICQTNEDAKRLVSLVSLKSPAPNCDENCRQNLFSSLAPDIPDRIDDMVSYHSLSLRRRFAHEIKPLIDQYFDSLALYSKCNDTITARNQNLDRDRNEAEVHAAAATL